MRPIHLPSMHILLVVGLLVALSVGYGIWKKLDEPRQLRHLQESMDDFNRVTRQGARDLQRLDAIMPEYVRLANKTRRTPLESAALQELEAEALRLIEDASASRLSGMDKESDEYKELIKKLTDFEIATRGYLRGKERAAWVNSRP